MTVHLDAFGASEQLIDRFLSLPVMLLQDDLREISPQTLYTALQLDQVQASFLLLCVKHCADLEYFVA